MAKKTNTVRVGNWMWTLLLNGTVVFNLIHLVAIVSAWELLFGAGTVGEVWKSAVSGFWHYAIPGLLVVVPVISLLFWFLTAIISRKPSKRSWAIANILWFVITFVLVILVIVFFGPSISAFINGLTLSDLSGGMQ